MAQTRNDTAAREVGRGCEDSFAVGRCSGDPESRPPASETGAERRLMTPQGDAVSVAGRVCGLSL
jgi:hypothetical protein